MGFYVGGYIGKGLDSRPASWVGARLYSSWGDWPRPVKGDFRWADPGGWLFWQKSQVFLRRMGLTETRMKFVHGVNWRYVFREEIMAIDLASSDHAEGRLFWQLLGWAQGGSKAGCPEAEHAAWLLRVVERLTNDLVSQ